ncbi:MAG: Glycerol 2-dehydrogenase (NADP(+)) [Bogoriella megaspora]|nr:MAG: Glycerol 2-dehydrogenase (NADP(+)) [Bogoriella megaspora]
MSGTYFRLNNGVGIPAIGFGTFANERTKGETYKAVMCALEVGYRHLDCAWYYQNEDEVGDAVKDFLAKTPNIKRSDIFICTKVWNHLHEPDEVKWSLETSLKNLQTEYVDLFLVHWPIASEKNEENMPKIDADGKYVIKKELTEHPEPTWRTMEELYEVGKARSIGVSNWTIPRLKQLLKFAKVKPAVNQVEIHPFLPNDELVRFCFDHDIMPEAYSPLGSQQQVPVTGEKLLANKTLNEIAEKRGSSLGQVLIAWAIRRGYVVLPKSATPSRIESNFQFPVLTDEDFAAVNEVAKGRHTRFVNMKDTFGYDLFAEEP